MNRYVDSVDTKISGKWHARKVDMSQKLFLLACKEGGGGESSRKWSSLLTNGKEIFVMGRPPGMESSLFNLES